jgi:hypothetical protein
MSVHAVTSHISQIPTMRRQLADPGGALASSDERSGRR